MCGQRHQLAAQSQRKRSGEEEEKGMPIEIRESVCILYRGVRRHVGLQRLSMFCVKPAELSDELVGIWGRKED